MLSAQVVDTATLTGTVRDDTGLPVPHAPVTAASATSVDGAQRTVETDARGIYRIVGLVPGTYDVSATAPGFAVAKLRNVPTEAGSTVTVDLRLAVSSVEQAVSVDATSPMLDVTTASKTMRLDRLLLDNLPTDRTVAHLVDLMPGINAQVGLGGVQQSNPLLIEGVNTASVFNLSPWSSINHDWVDEVQVVETGAGAEHDDFSGIVQVVRLRSGGDRLALSGEARTTPPRWVDANTDSLSAAQKRTIPPAERIVSSDDGSAEIGGPLVHRRAWAFGGVQTIRNNRIPALYDGPGSTDDNDRRGLIRIDVAAAPSVRIGGLWETDRHRTKGDGLGPLTPLETTTTDTQPNNTWRVGANVINHRALLTFSASGSGGRLSYDPTAPGTRSGPSPHYDVVTGMSSGNTQVFIDRDSQRRTVSGRLTRDQVTGPGRHTFDIGGEFEWSHEFSAAGYPGGRFYFDNTVPYPQVELWDGYAYTAGVHRSAVFAQDKWAIGRLVFEPGIRLTHRTGVLSQGAVLGNATWSPRFGIAWDVTGLHNTVVTAHVGRYVDAVLTPTFSYLDAIPDAPIIEAVVVGPDQLNVTSVTVPVRNKFLDPSIRPPYFDEYVGGVSRIVNSRLIVDTQVIARRYRRFMAFTDTGSVYVPVQGRDPGPDGVVGNADDGGLITAYRKTNPGNEHYVYTNPPGAYRNYTAAQVVARYRPLRNTELRGSYTWSRTRGNVENTIGANASGPELWTNGVFADPNRAINNDGPASFDFTHDVKLLGTVAVPALGGVTLSGVYRYHSGVAWARSVQRVAGIGQILYGVHVEPRGARRTPALNSLDLRLEKIIPISAGRRVGVFIDGFNVTNQGIPDPGVRRAVFEVSGPSFQTPLAWVTPRTARAGVRVTF